MNVSPPTFRKHRTGVYFCHWGGRDHYFTLDRAESFKMFQGSLEEWREWFEQRAAARKATAVKPSPFLTLHALAERFFATRLAEGGKDRLGFYRKHTKRFLAAYSTAYAHAITADMLETLKQAMIAAKKSAKTVNHDLQAVKTMMQWAMDLCLVPPVNLRGVKKLPLGEIPEKWWPLAQVKSFILETPDPNMRAWLAVQYLCALRPKEIVRIMTGQGVWEQRGIMRIPNKMGWKQRVPRRVLFSAEAFHWWRQCRPQWSRLDSYSHAVVEARQAGPHRLRHSAGTHLIQRGVVRADVDAILGHYPGEVSLIYTPLQWRRLRYLAARLTLSG